MKYKSICCVCLRETPETDNICELSHIKNQQGFIYVQVHVNFSIKGLNFCPSCAKKPITVEKLMSASNYTGWSY